MKKPETLNEDNLQRRGARKKQKVNTAASARFD